MNDNSEDTVIALYCLTDDLLRSIQHRDDSQRQMSDAEVITTAITAMRSFGGNYAEAMRWLGKPELIPKMLSRGRFSRRLHRLADLLAFCFDSLGQLWQHLNTTSEYAIDSMPIACCDNFRIARSQLYPLKQHGKSFRGYIASKRRHFYGLRIHLLCTCDGEPVEVFLAPASNADVGALKRYRFDLPPGSTIYADRAYNDYQEEDLMAEAGNLHLSAMRKKNSKRPVSAAVAYIQHARRKMIETTNSRIEALLPKHIHATSPASFELKAFLFVLAVSFSLALR